MCIHHSQRQKSPVQWPGKMCSTLNDSKPATVASIVASSLGPERWKPPMTARMGSSPECEAPVRTAQALSRYWHVRLGAQNTRRVRDDPLRCGRQEIGIVVDGHVRTHGSDASEFVLGGSHDGLSSGKIGWYIYHNSYFMNETNRKSNGSLANSAGVRTGRSFEPWDKAQERKHESRRFRTSVSWTPPG